MLGVTLYCFVIVACATRLPEPIGPNMEMLVEDNYTVRLDGVWLRGRPAIEAALKHVHDNNPNEMIDLIRRPRATISDWDAAMALVIDAGLSGGYVEVE